MLVTTVLTLKKKKEKKEKEHEFKKNFAITVTNPFTDSSFSLVLNANYKEKETIKDNRIKN